MWKSAAHPPFAGCAIAYPAYNCPQKEIIKQDNKPVFLNNVYLLLLSDITHKYENPWL
jgi:hypothetical protein